MTPDDIYNILTDAISTNIPDEWTIARVNVQMLDNGQDIEFDGFYLTPSGDAEVLVTEFPADVTDAVQTLYRMRLEDGMPPANRLQIDLTPQGQFTTDFSWDQEMQDEDDHFSRGGTAAEWLAIREERYGKPETND